MSTPPPEVSGRKFLLYFLFPAIIIFGIVLKVLGPDKPLGGPSTLYPPRGPTPVPSPTPVPPGTSPAVSPSAPVAQPASKP